jgi:leucyl aminopeptidase
LCGAFAVAIGNHDSGYLGMSDEVLDTNLTHAACAVDEYLHEENLIRLAP